MSNTEAGIYAFVSRVSGFRYIGQSVNLQKRKYEHLRRLGKGSHICKHLQSHYAKHGPDSLEYLVLEICLEDLLTEREQYFMDAFRVTGLFNTAPAAGSCRGRVLSAEARLKIGLAGLGRKASAETRKKQSDGVFARGNLQKGVPRSEETIKRMSEALTGMRQTPEAIKNRIASKFKNGTTRLGIPRDDETRAKLSAANLGKKMSEEAKQKIRAALSGKKKSPEHVAKVRAAHLGRQRTPEAIEKQKATLALKKLALSA